MSLDQTTLETLGAPISSLANLAEDVRREFLASPYQELRRAVCRLEEGRLVLRGDVSTYYVKQLAQSLLHNRFGQQPPVENRLQVTAGLAGRSPFSQGE